ncbi:MAG: transketolase [Chlamydiota bacterium]
MEENQKNILQNIANTIKQLSIEAVQKANSGHPGLPLGCAEIGAYLYGVFLQHNPKNPHWSERDYFLLSAGHGSMFLYSLLHLAGFPLSLEDITQFRQLHSRTPGHPEYGVVGGVEITSGPLGQGVGQAVGLALGLQILSSKFSSHDFSFFKNKVVCLAGDGCMMEGVSSEVSSLAGHLRLDNLILIYDANNVCLDGPLSDCCSENTKERYLAYGWDVWDVDGHDIEALDAVFSSIRKKQEKPTLIIARTTIGKGSPNKAGTHKVHGSPLGEAELKATKLALGLPEEAFFVSSQVRDFFAARVKEQTLMEKKWKEKFDVWKNTYPKKYLEWERMEKKTFPKDIEEILKNLEMKSVISGREASHKILQYLGESLPFIYGGSADLSCSDMTFMEKFSSISPGHFEGRNIKFGPREFGMATMVNGLALTGRILPFCGTFLTFSDYMKNAIRLCALSSLQVVYQFTHDSIFLGEDGPTHQPVEQLASLRSIPNMQVIRPADSFEVKMAWLAAFRHKGPTAIVLSRQALPLLTGTALSYDKGMGLGAYILSKEKKNGIIDYILFATGSEVKLALDVAVELEKRGENVRVVSVPCFEIFEKQALSYQKDILGHEVRKRVSLEAGSSFGWHRFIGLDGISIGVDIFGLSAPASVLAQEFGFTVDRILQRIL